MQFNSDIHSSVEMQLLLIRQVPQKASGVGSFTMQRGVNVTVQCERHSSAASTIRHKKWHGTRAGGDWNGILMFMQKNTRMN